MATNQATVIPPFPVTIGLRVVYFTRYVIRIKKHLHNGIEIMEIESNRKEYESLHPYIAIAGLHVTSRSLTILVVKNKGDSLLWKQKSICM